jgi:hypothetical protein
VFNLSASLPGIAEYLAETTLGGGLVNLDLLKNSFTIPGVFNAKYNLFDIEAGLDFGLQQTVTLNTPVDVLLKFDQPVTASYQVFQYNKCTSDIGVLGDPPVDGPCTGPQQKIDCGILANLGHACTVTPVYSSFSQDSTNDQGWIDLPPAAQGTAVNLNWDNGTPGNLTSRLYEMGEPTETISTDLTITPDLNISALCASITVAGGLFSGSVPCAWQQDYKPTPIVIPLGAAEVNLTQNCMTANSEFGTDATPFICAGPPRILIANPDPTLPTAPDQLNDALPDPNDIVSMQTDSPQFDTIPEPSGLLLLGVGLAALRAGRFRRGGVAAD